MRLILLLLAEKLLQYMDKKTKEYEKEELLK